MLAGVVLGASLTIGALGLFVWRRTDEANRAIEQAAASAVASVEAENDRRREAADRAFWAAQAALQDAAAAIDAGSTQPAARRRPKKP